MEFSTTLPPGFTTWNELWNRLKTEYEMLHPDEREDFISMELPHVSYNVDFIKARAYDEIMDLAINIDRSGFTPLNRQFAFAEKFSELTHTKLFN